MASWKLPSPGAAAAAASPMLLAALVAAVIVVPCLQMQACTAAADVPAPEPAPASGGPAICTEKQQELLDKINAFDPRKPCALKDLTGLEIVGECDNDHIKAVFGLSFDEQMFNLRKYREAARVVIARLLAQAFPGRQAPCMCAFVKALEPNGRNQEIVRDFDVSIRLLISETDPGFVC